MLQKLSLSKPFIIFIVLALITGSAFVLAPICTNMDLLTFVASLSTKTISINELEKGKLKNFILIDVRTPEEYEEDHIDRSVLVPLTDIERGIGVQGISSMVNSRVKSQKNTPIVLLYCTSGRRAIKAYKALETKGIPSVVLAGGIVAWRKSITPEQDATILH